MDEYLQEVKGLCDQLASVGSPVTEKMKICAMLHGLGREYEPIKTSIKGSMDLNSEMMFDDVVPRLKGYDDRLKLYVSKITVSPHLAFNVTTSGIDSNFTDFSNFRGSVNTNFRFGINRGRGLFSTRGQDFHQQISSGNSDSLSDNRSRVRFVVNMVTLLSTVSKDLILLINVMKFLL
ncbi:uncharacterized protein LOC112082037 [Eutrema salsugineum]|uniref:uncharacterized protein LOC112082037 n=1 Tax=Eutrema salsugineum TaxID=72664 RepID=UPI000CED1921|nr:uncharacterized protein LOC112082037 [Eutrema salsugineum]